MRVEEAKRILAELPDHYSIDILDVERSEPCGFHVVRTDESNEVLEAVEACESTAGDVVNDLDDLIEELGREIDKIEVSSPAEYKNFLRLRDRLKKISDLAGDLRDHLWEIIK